VKRWGANLPVTIDVIVEREFLVLLDRATRENAHPDVLPDRPLCDEAIRVARVIREPADPTALSCIDELRRRRLNRHQNKGLDRPHTSSFCNIMK
jgi:hypothetical protein